MCKIFSAKPHLVCVNLVVLRKLCKKLIALSSGKIYTACTNFTRTPVVTVATNLNSTEDVPEGCLGSPYFTYMDVPTGRLAMIFFCIFT